MEQTAMFSLELEHYLDVVPDLMCITDLNGRFVHFNKAWSKVVEHPEIEMTGHLLIDWVHQDDISKIFERISLLKNGLANDPLVLRIKFLKSDYRAIEWRTSKLNDTVFWTSRDVTSDYEDKKKMQDILIASEEFLEMLPEEVDYQKIGDHLAGISGAKYVIVNIFEDEGNDYTTRAVSGVKDSIKKASKFIGFSFDGKKWPNDPIRYERTKAQGITRFEDLMDFAGYALPHVLIRLFDSTFNLGEIYLAKIEKDGIVLGDFTMLMEDGQKFCQHALVEIFTRQIGLLITRHAAEIALRESEARFRDLFDKDLTGNFISSVDGDFILINEAFARIFGYDTVGQMMVQRAESTYSNLSDRLKFVDIVRKKKHLDFYEESLRRRDGQEIVVLENVIGEFDENGGLVRIKGYLIDITDRKRAENQLRDSERLLKESQEISRIGSYVLDIQSGVWIGSVVLDSMFGIAASDDHSVEGWLSLIHPEDRDMMANYFAYDVLQLRSRFDKEYRILPKNSLREIWVHGIGEVEFNENLGPVKMIGTIQDISDRRIVQDILRQSEEKYRMLVEQIDEVIFVLNDHGVIEYMSPVIQQLTGYPPEHYYHKTFDFFVAPVDLKMLVDAFNDLRNGINYPSEFRILTKNDEECWVRTSSKQFESDAHEIGYRGVVQNITSEKNHEKLLKEALRKAEASDRLKTAFLNNISHEVRTPLNGILGFGELITQPDLSPAVKASYLEILNSSSNRLLNTINDYMDISLISSGNIEVRCSLFNLHDLMSSVYHQFGTLAKAKNLDFCIIWPDLPKNFLVDTDGELLRKVLSHLIDNAIKYSSQGTINLGFEKKSEILEFFIQDQGIGISEDKKAGVFESFIQEDTANSRSYEGSGLGLSISKGIVELLGGTIWVDSVKGKGSIFRFTIRQSMVN